MLQRLETAELHHVAEIGFFWAAPPAAAFVFLLLSAQEVEESSLMCNAKEITQPQLCVCVGVALDENSTLLMKVAQK